MERANFTPQIIQGNTFIDDRGRLDFMNDFHFKGVKRFYFIENINTDYIRAWQGHQVEKKFFYVVQGSFLLAWVKIDNWENPSPGLVPGTIVLKASEPKVLIIPPGYANGMRSLEPGSRIMVMSDHQLEDSLKDKIRFDPGLWFNFETHAFKKPIQNNR